jgi:hypothetical protein
MYDLEYLKNRIEKKNNIMCEYLMLKQVTKPYRGKFDCRNAKSVNISDTELVLFKDSSVRSVKYLRSDFYYSIFLIQKFINHYTEENGKISSKYLRIVFGKYLRSQNKTHVDNKISKFNYKLLHCIIYNNLSVSK